MISIFFTYKLRPVYLYAVFNYNYNTDRLPH